MTDDVIPLGAPEPEDDESEMLLPEQERDDDTTIGAGVMQTGDATPAEDRDEDFAP